MKSFDEIVAELRGRPDCHFRPATRLPVLPPDLRLPPDLAAFYERFSEARLFISDRGEARCSIQSPEELVQVGQVILGCPTVEGIERSWYAVVNVCEGDYVAIDLLPERLGRCYDCFHETYGWPGYCTVIALSFTELLNCLAEMDDWLFWLDDAFQGYGDAYDNGTHT
jgi:hypothetical protein